MSLLLQALKKAEEAKRQREGMPVESAPAQQVPDLPPQMDSELVFPVLDVVSVEAVAGSTQEDHSEPSFDLVLEGDDEAPSAEVSPASEHVISLDLEPVTPMSLAPGADLQVEAEVAPVAPMTAAPAININTPEPVVRVAQEVVPVPVPAPQPAVQERKSADAARTLISAPRAKSARNNAPWLVLAGCLLLGGVGAWIWWQINEVSGNVTPPAQLRALDASVPQQISGNASAPEILAPVAIPEGGASASAPVSSQATAVVGTPAVTAPTIKPSTVSRPPTGNKAAYIEPQPAPANGPKIERQTHEAAIPPALEAAWNAFQQGDMATAETQYRRMLASDSRNRDAMLGLAAIAARRGQKQESASWYKRVLALNPQDEDAQAGLLAADPDSLSERNEARLLQQGDRVDSPLLLGQYYAARNRWHEAQEHYFRAFAQNPDNADLAFNLAVSLDHINQRKLAADFYRKALALKAGSFDRAAAEKRLAEIMMAPK